MTEHTFEGGNMKAGKILKVPQGTSNPVDIPFDKELENLLNHHSRQNSSATPDFILAEYLIGCLEAFNKAAQARDKWYGRDQKPI